MCVYIQESPFEIQTPGDRNPLDRSWTVPPAASHLCCRKGKFGAFQRCYWNCLLLFLYNRGSLQLLILKLRNWRSICSRLLRQALGAQLVCIDRHWNAVSVEYSALWERRPRLKVTTPSASALSLYNKALADVVVTRHVICSVTTEWLDDIQWWALGRGGLWHFAGRVAASRLCLPSSCCLPDCSRSQLYDVIGSFHSFIYSFIHSFIHCFMSCGRAVVSSKASSPQSAIYCFVCTFPVSTRVLKVIQYLLMSSSSSSSEVLNIRAFITLRYESSMYTSMSSKMEYSFPL